MYDYNYFENYKSKKKSKSGSTLNIVIVFTLFFLIVAGIFGYTQFKKAVLIAEVLVLEHKLSTSDNEALAKTLQDKQDLLDKIKLMKADISNASTTLTEANPINQELIDAIVQSLPSDAQLNDINLDQESLSLSGKAAIGSAVLEYEHNLRLALVTPSIFVKSITFADNEYTFEMSINFGGDAVESIQ